MPPKKQVIKKEPLDSDLSSNINESDIKRLCDSVENKLDEIVAEIISFKNKLNSLFARQNQIAGVETFLNEICSLIHVAFPDAIRTVVLKLNHQEIIYARKLVLLENIIDKTLIDLKIKNESYQNLFRLKIRILVARTDLMWFTYCKIKMIKFDRDNIEMDFLGVPRDLEQDFINLRSYLSKKPEISFIASDVVTLEYFFYGMLAFFRYKVLNKNEIKSHCLSFLNEIFNFLSSLKNVVCCKKGIIFLVKTVLDRWSLDSKDFPAREILDLLSKHVPSKAEVEVSNFIDNVSDSYVSLAEFNLVFKQKLDVLKRKINSKKQAKASFLVLIDELTIFCRKKLFVVPFNSLEIFFLKLKVHMHFYLRENEPLIATTFCSEYKFLENFVESYVENLFQTLCDVNSLLDSLLQNDLLTLLKKMSEKELRSKLLADQVLFVSVNSDVLVGYFDLLKLKLTVLELLVALNSFVPKIINYVCVKAKQSFELFKSEVDSTENLLLFFEKLNSVKLQILEQKESLFQKLLKSAAQGKNNRFLAQKTSSEQSRANTVSKSKTIVPGFFQSKNVGETLNVLSGSASSNQPIKKRDELLDKLDPKLNQAYEKIQQNQIEEACNLYRQLLNLPFTELRAFSLIHAAWGLADCLKAQSISTFKTGLKKKLIKQARCLYEKALALIDKTATHYVEVESVIDELEKYREFIWQELNIYNFSESKRHEGYLSLVDSRIEYSDKLSSEVILLKDFIDPDVQAFFKSLLTEKINCWVIGGFVRDYLLKHKPKDCDVLVFANQTSLVNFLNKNNIVFKVLGKTYPIITIKFQAILVELTCVNRTCDADSFLTQYCDFTINGSYYDVMKNQLVISEVTKVDLMHKKTVAMFEFCDVKKRLLADPALIFRAIYFACKYDFSLDHLLSDAFPLYKKCLPDFDLNKKNRIFTAVVKLFINGFATKSLKLIKNIDHLINLDSTFSMLQIVATGMDNDFRNNKSPSITLLIATLLLNEFERALVNASEKTALKDINLYTLMENVIDNCVLGSPVTSFKQTVMQIWYLWLQKKYEQLNLNFEFTMPVELKDCFVMEHFLNANELLNLEKLVNRISLLPVEFLNPAATLTL